MRLFFALWPPLGAAEALCAWARRVRRKTGGSVVRAANIHLTLAFLGDVGEARVPELRRVPVWGERHALPIERTGYWARNRILWAGPETAPAPAVALADRLRDMLAARDFRTERSAFAAHVTLLRKAREPEDLPPLPELDWPVEECVLVQSELSAQGSRYQVLERYPLA
jgi:RNA 2',3'-cyclic 3'-phosphodiesterase